MALIWCILTNTLIGICFKLFPTWKIKALPAIVINYTVCFLLGILLVQREEALPLSAIVNSPWFKFDILLGSLFIIGFNLTAFAIARFGIAQSLIMQKMSIVLTVAFAVFFFREHFGWLTLAGLVCSALAIITIHHKKKENKQKGFIKSLLPLFLVWLFAAAIEILLLYVQKTDIIADQQLMFTTIGFGMAAVIGWIYLIITVIKKHFTINGRDLIAGVILGIPNFFSIYLLLILLEKGWKGSILYPVLNVSILLLSALAAIFFFKEALTKVNKWGIVLAVIAIAIFAWAENQAV